MPDVQPRRSIEARLAAYRKRWPEPIGEEHYSGRVDRQIGRYAVMVFNERYGEPFVDFYDTLEEVAAALVGQDVWAVHDLDEGRDLEYTVRVEWRDA